MPADVLRADKKPDFVLRFQNRIKYFENASEIIRCQPNVSETFDLNVVPGAQF